MRPKFLADADIDERIVKGVLRREPAIEFWTARELQLRAKTDPEMLAEAAAHNAVLVTHDVNTMIRHFSDYVREGKRSAGLIVAPQSLATGVVVEQIVVVWLISEAAEWENRVIWLPI